MGLSQYQFKWHLDPIDPSSRLATTDMGRKFGGLLHVLYPLEGNLVPIMDGPHLTQCGVRRDQGYREFLFWNSRESTVPKIPGGNSREF